MVDKLKVRVYGNVQGVGFRYNIVNFASGSELTGYAENLPDGTVEVFAEGPKDSLVKLIDFIKNNPGSSNVRDVDTKWGSPANRDFSDFRIKF